MDVDVTNYTNALKKYILQLEERINNLRIVTRVFTRYPFDYVALEIVSKAFALAKACLVLLEAGLPDEAYGLSRTIVECAATLRYLTQDVSDRDNRTMLFVKYIFADKNFWLHYALQSSAGATEEEEIRAYAKEHGFIANTKEAGVHWSKQARGFMREVITSPHPLDPPTWTEQASKREYAVEYHRTSQFVHCSQPALNNYVPKECCVYVVSPSQDFNKSHEIAFFTTFSYLHEVVSYATYGLNLGGPSLCNDLYEATFAEVKYMAALRHRSKSPSTD